MIYGVLECCIRILWEINSRRNLFLRNRLLVYLLDLPDLLGLLDLLDLLVLPVWVLWDLQDLQDLLDLKAHLCL
jgi:hypothetical protein